MLGLVKKDLYTYWESGQLKIMAIFILIYGAIAVINHQMSFISGLCVAFSAVIPVNTLVTDEKSGWNTFAITLPLQRKDIVWSKYLLSLGFTGGFSLIFIVASFFAEREYLKENLAVAFTLAGVILFWISIGYPILFYRGAEKGKLIMIGILFFPMIVFLAAQQTLEDGQLEGLMNIFSKVGDWYLAGGYLVVFLCVCILFFLSALVSVKIFNRKEL